MTMKPLALIAASALLGAQIVLGAQPGERFENATAGIALSRPAGWQTASLQSVQDNRARVRLADPELQQALQTQARVPLCVFTKYPEPYPSLNPSIQITLRPSGSL